MHIRDLPGEVTATLYKRAAAEGTSLSAYVRAELIRIASRPTNADIANRLKTRDRSGGPTAEDTVSQLQADRR